MHYISLQNRDHNPSLSTHTKYQYGCVRLIGQAHTTMRSSLPRLLVIYPKFWQGPSHFLEHCIPMTISQVNLVGPHTSFSTRRHLIHNEHRTNVPAFVFLRHTFYTHSHCQQCDHTRSVGNIDIIDKRAVTHPLFALASYKLHTDLCIHRYIHSDWYIFKTIRTWAYYPIINMILYGRWP